MCSKSPAKSEKNGRVRNPYPSDITHKKFEVIKPLLESARKIICPRRIDLHEVFCAVLYLLKSGCQWRMLPKALPKLRTLHSYFSIWSEPHEGGSLLEQALKNQMSAARKKQGRSSSSTLLIVDSQSVKNTDTAGLKGDDASKVSRASSVTLRWICKGTLQDLSAERQGFSGHKACFAMVAMWANPLRKACVRSWASGLPSAVNCRGFEVMPTRWVVERSFACLEKKPPMM